MGIVVSSLLLYSIFIKSSTVAAADQLPMLLPFLLSVDSSELLTPDPVELQCVPMETHFCPIPKLLVAAAPMALNSVSLSRNPS